MMQAAVQEDVFVLPVERELAVHELAAAAGLPDPHEPTAPEFEVYLRAALSFGRKRAEWSEAFGACSELLYRFVRGERVSFGGTVLCKN